MNLQEAMAAYPPIWTIYDHPKDFPNHFVVRVWYGECETPEVWLRDTLEAARYVVHCNGGEVCLLPADEDDDVIVESWI